MNQYAFEGSVVKIPDIRPMKPSNIRTMTAGKLAVHILVLTEIYDLCKRISKERPLGDSEIDGWNWLRKELEAARNEIRERDASIARLTNDPVYRLENTSNEDKERDAARIKTLRSIWPRTKDQQRELYALSKLLGDEKEEDAWT